MILIGAGFATLSLALYALYLAGEAELGGDYPGKRLYRNWAAGLTGAGLAAIYRGGLLEGIL